MLRAFRCSNPEGLLIRLEEQKDKVFGLTVQPTLTACSLPCRAALEGRQFPVSPQALHTEAARVGPGPCWRGPWAGLRLSALQALLGTTRLDTVNVVHTAILHFAVLKCLCNGYNNHLTNNLEQALIASNAVLWLRCGESRDTLAVTALL